MTPGWIAAVALALLQAAPASAQSSNAARWLVDQQIAAGCASGQGRFNAEGIFERDLNGDGRDDLILAHSGLECTGDMVRSLMCGMQVCSYLIFLRDGDLLVPQVEALAGGITVSDDAPPFISGYSHGGGQWSVRWNGSDFAGP